MTEHLRTEDVLIIENRLASAAFAGAMVEKLDKNIHKGHWSDAGNTIDGLLKHFDEEVAEFKAAIQSTTDRYWLVSATELDAMQTAVRNEGADVGNLAMMLMDRLGVLRQ